MKKILYMMAMSCAVIGNCVAQNPGDLDSTFNVTGYRKQTDTLDHSQTMAIRSMVDARVVVAGIGEANGTDRLLVYRYLSDGTPDTSFNHTGGLLLTEPEVYGSDMGMDVQADGKILLAAGTNDPGTLSMVVKRLNVDGSPDAGFANGGTLLLTHPMMAWWGQEVFATDNGKMVVIGNYEDSLSSQGLFLNGYLSDGSADPNYGINGVRTVPFGNLGEVLVIAADLNADGSITILAMQDSASESKPMLVRVTPQGAIDMSFGIGGIQRLFTTDFDGDPYDLATNASKEVFVCGSSPVASNYAEGAVRKYHTNGAIDLGFGQMGLASFNDPGGDTYLSGIVVQADGKPVVAGEVQSPSGDFMVARLQTNGMLDTGFGIGGTSSPYIQGIYDAASCITLQADGKLLVGGYWTPVMNKASVMVARYEAGSIASAVANPETIQMLAYPNPTQGLVTLQWELPQAEEIKINVLDLMGRQVLPPLASSSVAAGKWTETLDLGHLATGAYWVELRTAEAKAMVKVILAR